MPLAGPGKFDDALRDDSVGKIICKAEGRARHFKCEVQNLLGFGIDNALAARMTTLGDPTAWLGWEDSNSEMSWQNIPLKARADFQNPSRIPAMETTRV
jgi:hypothetical protein